MIPGSDLLDFALRIIGTQTVQYIKTNGRTLNSIGQYIPSFDDPVNVNGSMQPIPRYRYEMYGLDFDKNYYTFYVSDDFIGTDRDVSGDQIIFNNNLFQVQSTNDWFAEDGWQGVLCVMIGVAS
jgi:hypothetical protein